MQPKISLNMISLAVATVMALTACGGESSNSNNQQNTHTQTTSTATGVFLDSAVQGLEVVQNGKSLGKTNEKGEYTYSIGGGAVSFKLGDLTLGSTMPKSVVTPADLTTDHKQIVRILQTLQSVDHDNNPDNGILITDKVASRFVASDFGTLVNELDNNKFTEMLKPKLDTNQFVKSKAEASSHFAKTVAKLETTNSLDLSNIIDQFVGYWQQSCVGGRQEVFQMKKVNANTATSTGNVLKRKYPNNDCTGTPVETSYPSSEDPVTVKIIGIAQTNSGKQVIHTLRTEIDQQSNPQTFIGSLIWHGNHFTGEEGRLTFTRVNSLAFH